MKFLKRHPFPVVATFIRATIAIPPLPDQETFFTKQAFSPIAMPSILQAIS